MHILSFIFSMLAIISIIFIGLFFEKYYKYYLCIFEDSTYTTFSGIFFNLSIKKLEKRFNKNVYFCLIYKDSYSLTAGLLHYNKLYTDINRYVLTKNEFTEV